MAGAALSGLLAQTGSFRLTFLVSAGALLASLPVWAAAEAALPKRSGAGPVLPARSASPGGGGAAQTE